MGLLQELNIKPGVIYGDDVLKVRYTRHTASLELTNGSMQ